MALIGNKNRRHKNKKYNTKSLREELAEINKCRVENGMLPIKNKTRFCLKCDIEFEASPGHFLCFECGYKHHGDEAEY
jgi:hypothetical protein